MRDLFSTTGSKEKLEILPFEASETHFVYYQIRLGNFGVVLTDTFNSTTLNGISLVQDKATAINDKGLALRLAKTTGGKLLEVHEDWSRKVSEVRV